MNYKIKVLVPKKGDLWKINLGNGRPRKRSNAVLIFGQAERFLNKKFLTKLESKVEDKIEISVDYHLIHDYKSLDWKNEGVYAQKDEALFMLACYLEDFLPISYQKKKYKLYGNKLV